MATASLDKTLRIWKTADWSCIRTIEHPTELNSCRFSSDGTWICTGGDDNKLRIWKTDDGTCLAVLEGHANSIRSCATDPTNSFIVSGSIDKTLRIWDVPKQFQNHEVTIFL